MRNGGRTEFSLIRIDHPKSLTGSRLLQRFRADLKQMFIFGGWQS